MIPSVVASQVKQGIEGFLRSTFPISTIPMKSLLDSLFEETGGLCKGPYLSIDLPFRASDGDQPFLKYCPLAFTPHRHQEQSFARLAQSSPRSTLIATGTGSGKTECFLNPILEYCYTHREESGIKAIIVYPMNALATDQARRIARTVSNSPFLRGNVRAGLFVGESESNPKTSMEPDMVVTSKDALRERPPDILLTNYKMLDYLLIRPRDRTLWQGNDPETLKFLVVDELHTFDGAQGTDLACLIRRLKARLQVPLGHLCCIGTSATLGNKDDASKAKLISYAESIFGEQFDGESVITEDRLSFLEYFPVTETDDHYLAIPSSNDSSLSPTSFHSANDYILAQANLWFGNETHIFTPTSDEWRVQLGEKLNRTFFFQQLVSVLNGTALDYQTLATELSVRCSAELAIADTGILPTSDHLVSLIDSITALASVARRWQPESDDQQQKREGENKARPTMPFLHVRVQIWLRELKRLVAPVDDKPTLRFFDDLKDEDRKRHLPVVHCRACGSAGWTMLRRTGELRCAELRDTYKAYFGKDKDVYFLFPLTDSPEQPALGRSSRLCKDCFYLNIHDRKKEKPFDCAECSSSEFLLVDVPDNSVQTGGHVKTNHDCPYCLSSDGLSIMGAQAASLTGVMVSTLFASPWNDDPKLIAFSDSVQDAAHRAGFIESRAYNICLRSGIQRALESTKNSVPLNRVVETFLAFWGSHWTESEMVGTFIHPDLEWHEDFDALKETNALPEGGSLRDFFRRRLDWDIHSEYGFKARIGRTLERAGSSVAFINPENFQKALIDIHTAIINEFEGGPLELNAQNTLAISEQPLSYQVDSTTLKAYSRGLSKFDKRNVSHFLQGLLTHLKLQGGVIHPICHGYMAYQGKSYLLNKHRWMPDFGRYASVPRFFTDGASEHHVFEQIIGPPKERGWTRTWLQKTGFVHANPLISSYANDLYEATIRCLIKNDILEELQTQNARSRVWGIKPSALLVTTEVMFARCSHCGHEAALGQPETDLWKDLPCLREECIGKYATENINQLDYYRMLYSHGNVLRVVAAEHTGLLKREVREPLEQSFIERKHPWDPNVLCATSTLEMGINIGDLSSVALCSVPPAQANYLQRVGRAGRRDGNALCMTIATGRPHDLYFFSDPGEMISGNVDSPGIFLNASAILQRQLTAYCLDRWVASGISDTEFAPKLGTVLDHVERNKSHEFPFNWRKFVEDNQDALVQGFLDLFQRDISDDTRTKIRTFLIGTDSEPALTWRIINSLHELVKERESLWKRSRMLVERIKKKQEETARSENYEQELEELKREKAGLLDIRKEMESKQTLNFLTDEGLIPNYAFPEAGVILRSVIYRRRERARKTDDKKYETWSYEYERPSSSAISEFAPANFFYAEGRKVKIDQVNLSMSNIEPWRLCRNCTYAERGAVEPQTKECPRCADAWWADSGQLKQMVRLRQVMASANDRTSRIGDESDDRTGTYFTKQLLVDFDASAAQDSYFMSSDEYPFGFEYLQKASFREINSGEKEVIGSPVRIAGIEAARKGFTVCKHCGKVQTSSSLQPGGQPEHTFTCPARSQTSPANFIEILYLYREFQSEAVRILLPITDLTPSNRLLHSFIAALHLGIKLHFGGKVDHLRSTVYEECLPNSNFKKKYVMLYDTVPGGTGYLKQMVTGEGSQQLLLSVLQAAFERLRSCECNRDPDKDGCYRCLYAYRNSYDMPQTSRQQAVDQLSEILGRRNSLQRVENLSRVKVSGLLDSVLEQLFIDRLATLPSTAKNYEFKREIVNGKAGYYFRTGEEAYYIEPQVLLGTNEGVDISSKPDFVFWPSRRSADQKPIAIFLDGFEFHRDRIAEDLNQRMAISRSGRYVVWSLTWDDINGTDNSRDRHFTDYLSIGTNPIFQANDGARASFIDGFKIRELASARHDDSFALLFRYLRKPDQKLWQNNAYFYIWTFLDNAKFGGDKSRRMWEKEHNELVVSQLTSVRASLTAPCVLGEASYSSNDQLTTRVFACIAESSAKQQEVHQAYFAAVFDDSQRTDLKKDWCGTLRLHNFMQFIPNCFITTFRALSSDGYRHVDVPISTAAVTPTISPVAAQTNAAWQEALKLVSSEARPIVKQAFDAGWDPPEPGYDIAATSGEVIGTAELAWPQRRLALLIPDQEMFSKDIQSAGWKVYLISESSALFSAAVLGG